MAKNFPAPPKCVDAVEASVTKTFDDGLAYERELFKGLMLTPESKALRHAFFAERAASKIPDVPEDTPQRKIKKVAVIGAGTMGGGISMNFLNAGIPVTILEMKQEALDRGIAHDPQELRVAGQEGQAQAGQVRPAHGLLKTTLSYDDIKDADLVIEAVFEEMGVKEKVFKKLDEVMKPGAILATNTSTLDVEQDRVVHQAPAGRGRPALLQPGQRDEAARGGARRQDREGRAGHRDDAGQDDQEDGGRLGRLRRLHRQPHDRAVLAPGRLPARRGLHAAAGGQGDREVSASRWGRSAWATSPATTSAGRSASAARVEKPDLRYSKTADQLCEMGRFGQKTGAGWYDYQAGKRDAIPSPVVDKMIEDYRKELGITPRKISDDEIVQRLVYALVNEGAHILEEGIASKASDIDMVYLTGYGFPLHRGGPMCYADSQGLFNVVQA